MARAGRHPMASVARRAVFIASRRGQTRDPRSWDRVSSNGRRERGGSPQASEKHQDACGRVRSVCVREARRRELGDFDSGFGRSAGCGGDFAADLVLRDFAADLVLRDFAADLVLRDFAADLVLRFAGPRSCLAF
jgi:hypothetical protein